MTKRKGVKKYFLERKISKCVNAEIKPHWGSLWGQKHWCIPAYCGIIEGDGKQVIWLKTGDSRPNYYVMRIDSKTDIEHDDFNPEILYCGIEEIFDNSGDFEDFPALSVDNGAWWGIVKNFGHKTFTAF